MVTLILIFPICTHFQLHLPGDTISNCSSIDKDYYAGQNISSIEQLTTTVPATIVNSNSLNCFRHLIDSRFIFV